MNGGLNLGQLIEATERGKQKFELEDEVPIVFDFAHLNIGNLDSYRGYYYCLALGYENYSKPAMPVEVFLAKLREAVGRTYEGYKGGKYRMTEDTLLWVANWGETSNTVILGVEKRDYQLVILTGLE